jgi:hypothetical protein
MAKSALDKFFNKRQFDLLIFGYITAMRRNFPGVSVEKAIGQCLNEFDLEGQDVDAEAVRINYYRMDKLLNEAKRG